MGRLENKIALITGGTSGIGLACAERYCEEGASVVVTAREEEKWNQVKQELLTKGYDIDYISCDVSKRESVENLKKEFLKKHDRLDILVNNAGVLRTGALEEITDEDWNLTYDTNVKSILYVCQNFIDLLKENEGVVLNNTSINGLHDYIKGKRSYMYATSKSAAIQFTKYLAKNYAPEVRVNCLCPGMTVTNLFTNRDFSRFKGVNLLDRMADPREIANVALFLVSDEASFVTGSVVVADGGEVLM